MTSIIRVLLASLLNNYSRNYQRTSEAACRAGIDIILNECPDRDGELYIFTFLLCYYNKH
jgi:hypothetical protein